LQGAMLDALARAASPAAVGLLLDQPRRWRAWLDGHGRADLALDPAQIDAAVGRLGAEGLAPAQHLNRLIDPALALILGPPNVGKSTLTNLLAGRRVSITADEPGTTRDHVGVLLELDGQGPAGAQAAVAVRWADTPGIGLPGAGAADCAAEALALALAQEADVIVRAGDAVSGWGGAQGSPGNAAVLWANLRADLGPAPGWGAAGAPAAPLAVRADRPETIEALARAVRRAVVPDAAIGHPGPWRFW
ncbi:MAG: hypothetical protein C0468_02450, partial [Planctomyces sp.]|nr:hypothetical protein [Planctomyces sp.]